MKNNEKKERHCLTCGKPIRSSRKIRICQNCRNGGKRRAIALVSIATLTGLGILKKNSKN